MKDLSEIKCIVISGGGAMFFQMLGIFTEIIKNDTFDINNINDFYGCSAGSVLSVMFALNHNIETINKYFIDRPWHNLIKTDIFQVLSSFNTCGIINNDILIKSFNPLFKAKDLDISTITLKDFYVKTNKTVHIFSTNITDGEIVDFSHITHPDWLLIDALHASMCIPTVIEPVIKDNKCYIDGGVVNNFPINFALNTFKNNQIFGIKTEATIKDDTYVQPELKFDNMLDFVTYILFQSHSKLIKQKYIRDTPDNIIIIRKDAIDMLDLFSVLNSKDKRIEYFELGKIIYSENI